MLRSVIAVLLVVTGLTSASAQDRQLVIAATTSFQDSGLADVLAAAYRHRTGVTVKLISQPTSVALTTAHNGFVDVVIGNSPAAQDRFMDGGDGSRRIKMMFDDFVIAGPADDPAGVRGNDAPQALKTMAQKRATFVSRGDNSGTHVLEQSLWNAAGVNPKARSGNWYRETGLGMGLTLAMATRVNGYVLVDRGTWLAHPDQRKGAILVEGDPRLFNQYELIVVNPQKYPNLDPAAGAQFANWIASDDGQAAIAAFRIDGKQVFFPNAKGQN
ncbi:MAG: substrate-binding domain-containing protein [Xanthobacteraceae bacterium]